MHFTIPKSIGKNDKTYHDYPVFFELIKITNEPKIIEFFFNNENIEKCSNIKFKHKNIIQWFCDSNNLTKETVTIIEKILNTLIVNSDSFQKLVLNDKKTLKLISELKSTSIDKMIDVALLEQKLPQKIEIKNKSMKI